MSLPFNRPFAAFHSRVTKPAYWEANVANKGNYQITHAFCWSCPNATFASQYAGFIPRGWKPAKG